MRVNIGRNCPPLLKWCFFLFGSGFLLSCGNDNAQDPIAGKAPTAIIMASSSTASVNSAVTISWESTNSNTCIASGAWSGSKPTSGSESFTLVSAAPYNFKLNCYSTDSIINNLSTTASTTVSGYQVWDFVQRGLDLDGEAVDDMSGRSVSLSSDGSVVAIGASYNDANGSDSGHARVYAWNGTTWAQRGNDLDGEAVDDYSGHSVSLSSDGSVIAIGAYRNDANGSNSGHTRIYAWNGTTWAQRGNDLDGEAVDDMSGRSVSLSSDGTVIAIGAYHNDANGSDSGHTRIYAWNGTNWAKRGLDLDGEAEGDRSGGSVSLSSDGSVVAIGADRNDGNGSNSGHTRVYAWNGATWAQRGLDLDGEAAYDYSGWSVSLSSDGTVVAIGAYSNDANGNYSGHTRIYAWNGATWAQKGLDLDGEAANDMSGTSVSLSSDGTVVAIGANGNKANGNYSGHTRVYAWNGTAWTKRGDDLDGEAYDQSGYSLSLSSDGTVIAIGAPFNDGNGSDSGHTRVYVWQ